MFTPHSAASQPTSRREARHLDLILNTPLFDAAWYARRFPDVGLSGLLPECHYLRYGGPLGRPASPAFSERTHPRWHARAARGLANPLILFLQAGSPDDMPKPPPTPGTAPGPTKEPRA